MSSVDSGRGNFSQYRVELGTSWLCVRSVGTLLSSLGRVLSHFRYSRPPLSPLKAGDSGANGLAPSESQQPGLSELKARLDQSDRMAAMQALELALSELGDGVTLVWQRPGAQPRRQDQARVGLFRDDRGRVCRHVVYSLTLGTYQRQIEGVACREPNGSWSLSG
jgi:surface antigen